MTYAATIFNGDGVRLARQVGMLSRNVSIPSLFKESAMRFIMQVSLPVEKFNQAVRDGVADKTIARILEDAKPEAVYFCTKEGKRCGILIVNMSSTSEIPRLAEPWFLHFDAAIDFQPVMTPDDLQKAGLDQISKKWK